MNLHGGKPWERHEQIGKDKTFVMPKRYTIDALTLGWRPACDHGLEPISCTIMDPFAGSGTTLLVAEGEGRDSVGIELSEEYSDLV